MVLLVLFIRLACTQGSGFLFQDRHGARVVRQSHLPLQFRVALTAWHCLITFFKPVVAAGGNESLFVLRYCMPKLLTESLRFGDVRFPVLDTTLKSVNPKPHKP